MKKALVLASLTLFANLSSAQVADEMKAFPPAEPGMVRHVLQLPEQNDESAFKVELTAGKTVRIDTANRYSFGGTIETETIPGWGYSRYLVSPLGPMTGTLMAIDPEAPKEDRFVPIGGEPFLVRYNSRLPIVVYAPEGVEVRYRLWRSESEASLMDEG